MKREEIERTVSKGEEGRKNLSFKQPVRECMDRSLSIVVEDIGEHSDGSIPRVLQKKAVRILYSIKSTSW